jgi:hypothetical protein
MHNEHVAQVNEQALIAAAVEVLDRLGVCAVPRAAGMLTVSAGKGSGEGAYRVVVRARVTAPVAGAIEPAAGGATLVVAPFVPEPAAGVLRERGLDYVDAAGNAFLRWDGVLIDVRGHRPVAGPVAVAGPSARRPFTRSGAQVTFCLLAWPVLGAGTVREIARASGTAVGTVAVVLRDLQAGDYLLETASGRRLVRAGELLTRWTEAYALSLAASLHLGAYRAADPQWWAGAREELLDAGVDLGGEAAGSVMDAHLRPAGVLLYADAAPARILAAHRCRRVEDAREANVVVRRRFWTPPPGQAPPGQGGLVPPVLVYADLLVSGEPRQREHAQRLRTRDARLEQLDRT